MGVGEFGGLISMVLGIQFLNSLDMVEIIEKYHPGLWLYGRTHECDNQKIGKTRVISNQLEYPENGGSFECERFFSKGLQIEL